MSSLNRSFLSAILVITAMTRSTAIAHGADRITYDSQCVTIDGKDLIIFSGAFHYFRCPRELWVDRFRTLKAAGFNTLETYAAWNYHEPTPPSGPDDFSKVDMTELHDWLAMATDQFGFHIILRPGPYICAEWDGGGYPQWLLAMRPKDFKPREWFRSDEPSYLAWSRHWYAAVAKVAVPFQITHRPVGKSGIILWQIENEYDYSRQPTEVKHHQLNYLAHASRDLGIDIPLTTCLTDNAAFRNDDFLKQNVIETRNTYPKFDMGAMWRDIGMLYSYQPEKFKMITELQGGWFAQVGGELSEAQGFDETHINNITLNAWENGFTSTNYYMGFGGTNFGDWAAVRLTTTYDYDAPVRECGGVTARYFAVKALGEFIADHGTVLARSTFEKFNVRTNTDRDLHVAVRRGADGSRFLSLRNEQKGTHLAGSVDLTTTGEHAADIKANYDLGSFGGKVLFLPAGKSDDAQGTWYPKPQTVPQRPTDLPKPIELTDIRERADSGPTEWKPFDTDQTESEAGIFNRQFVFYRTSVPSQHSESKADLILLAQVPGFDWMGVMMDGKSIEPASLGRFPLGAADSEKQLMVLYENAGRPNFGDGLEQPSGLLKPRLMSSKGQPIALSEWKEKHTGRGEVTKSDVTADLDDSAWMPANVSADDGDLKPGATAVYRTGFDLTDAQIKSNWSLNLGRVDDDGVVFVNGQQAGESHDWTQAQHFDVSKFLHAGKNVIAVRVVNREGGGGLSHGADLEPVGTSVPTVWQFSQRCQGVSGKWWETNLDDTGWQIAKPEKTDSLLSWYRMKFELPTQKSDEWIPWRMNLNAKGNGFLYLNGHPLGRWWQAGPQHDFFLPECWLNFGPGKSNVITIEMRPADGKSEIMHAEVRPYENLAEKR